MANLAGRRPNQCPLRRRTLNRWVSAVRTLMSSCRAMGLVGQPCASRISTSRSRSDKPAAGLGVALGKQRARHSGAVIAAASHGVDSGDDFVRAGVFQHIALGPRRQSPGCNTRGSYMLENPARGMAGCAWPSRSVSSSPFILSCRCPPASRPAQLGGAQQRFADHCWPSPITSSHAASGAGCHSTSGWSSTNIQAHRQG